MFNFDWFTFFNLEFVARKQSYIKKMPKILLDDTFPEFSFGKIRFLFDFNLLTLQPFAVSFPYGGSTFLAMLSHFQQSEL